MIENGNGRATTIKLAEHRVFSDSFKPLYNQGMSLVEEAAEYLDGDGRAEASRGRGGSRCSVRFSCPPRWRR